MPNVNCDYCGIPVPITTGREVYPHRPDLYTKKFYKCWPCDALVGCHPGTDKPLGRLANAELRKAKIRAHAAFDYLWQSGWKRRGSCYAWLADSLNIPQKDCHIGMFDVDLCNRVVEVCEAQQIGEQDGTGTH